MIMKIRFNEAQLSRPQQKSLIEVCRVLQVENENEIEVTVVEHHFPNNLMVNLDNEISMVLTWDAKAGNYFGMTKPEPVQAPKPESLTETKPEPELDLSPVVERVEALARALVNLSKPLSKEQRIEVWNKFCVVLSEELWK